jgi:hypothetical protein
MVISSKKELTHDVNIHQPSSNVQPWRIADILTSVMRVFVMPYSAVVPINATIHEECSLIGKRYVA